MTSALTNVTPGRSGARTNSTNVDLPAPFGPTTRSRRMRSQVLVGQFEWVSPSRSVRFGSVALGERGAGAIRVVAGQDPVRVQRHGGDAAPREDLAEVDRARLFRD